MNSKDQEKMKDKGVNYPYKIVGMSFVEVDCSQPLYLRTQKKKRAKRARSTRGWGVASQVFRFALASSSLAILSARTIK